MKYMINLTNDEDFESGGPSSFGSGKFGFVLLAENMKHCRAKVLCRARNLGLEGWSAKIIRLEESGKYNNGTTIQEIFNPEREMILKIK